MSALPAEFTWARGGLTYSLVPLEHKRARIPWDPALHPRDRLGRFIETFSEVRTLLGGTGRVMRNVGHGRVEVQMSDGTRRVMHRNYLTVTARPDGSRPTGRRTAHPKAMGVQQASPQARRAEQSSDDDFTDLRELAQRFGEADEPDEETSEDRFTSLDELREHFRRGGDDNQAGSDAARELSRIADKDESDLDISDRGAFVAVRDDDGWRVHNSSTGQPVLGRRAFADQEDAEDLMDRLESFNFDWSSPGMSQRFAQRRDELTGRVREVLDGIQEEQHGRPERGERREQPEPEAPDQARRPQRTLTPRAQRQVAERARQRQQVDDLLRRAREAATVEQIEQLRNEARESGLGQSRVTGRGGVQRSLDAAIRDQRERIEGPADEDEEAPEEAEEPEPEVAPEDRVRVAVDNDAVAALEAGYIVSGDRRDAAVQRFLRAQRNGRADISRDDANWVADALTETGSHADQVTGTDARRQLSAAARSARRLRHELRDRPELPEGVEDTGWQREGRQTLVRTVGDRTIRVQRQGREWAAREELPDGFRTHGGGATREDALEAADISFDRHIEDLAEAAPSARAQPERGEETREEAPTPPPAAGPGPEPPPYKPSRTTAKRGDLVVLARTSRTSFTAGPSEERRQFTVHEVTSVTRDGKVKATREVRDDDGATARPIEREGRLDGVTVIPQEDVDLTELKRDVAAHTWPDSILPQPWDDPRELQRLIRSNVAGRRQREHEEQVARLRPEGPAPTSEELERDRQRAETRQAEGLARAAQQATTEEELRQLHAQARSIGVHRTRVDRGDGRLRSVEAIIDDRSQNLAAETPAQGTTRPLAEMSDEDLQRPGQRDRTSRAESAGPEVRPISGPIRVGDTVRSKRGHRLYRVDEIERPASGGQRVANRTYGVTDVETGLVNAFSGNEIERVRVEERPAAPPERRGAAEEPATPPRAEEPRPELPEVDVPEGAEAYDNESFAADRDQRQSLMDRFDRVTSMGRVPSQIATEFGGVIHSADLNGGGMARRAAEHEKIADAADAMLARLVERGERDPSAMPPSQEVRETLEGLSAHTRQMAGRLRASAVDQGAARRREGPPGRRQESSAPVTAPAPTPPKQVVDRAEKYAAQARELGLNVSVENTDRGQVSVAIDNGDSSQGMAVIVSAGAGGKGTRLSAFTHSSSRGRSSLTQRQIGSQMREMAESAQRARARESGQQPAAERARELTNQAQTAFKAGDYDRALELLDQAEQIAPEYHPNRGRHTYDDLRELIRRKQSEGGEQPETPEQAEEPRFTVSDRPIAELADEEIAAELDTLNQRMETHRGARTVRDALDQSQVHDLNMRREDLTEEQNRRVLAARNGVPLPDESLTGYEALNDLLRRARYEDRRTFEELGTRMQEWTSTGRSNGQTERWLRSNPDAQRVDAFLQRLAATRNDVPARTWDELKNMQAELHALGDESESWDPANPPRAEERETTAPEAPAGAEPETPAEESKPLPEDAKPLPGADGYHYTLTGSFVHVYNDQVRRIGEGFNSSRGGWLLSGADGQSLGRARAGFGWSDVARDLVARHERRESAAERAPEVEGVWVEHTPAGTLVHGTDRGDQDVADALREARGFKWSSRLGAWYLPRTWREDTRRSRVRAFTNAMNQRGRTIDVRGSDEPAPTAEERQEQQVARATERAERMEGRAARLHQEAERRQAASDAISDAIPMGQPILVGHHSEQRHRRDLDRMRRNQERAWDATREAREAENAAERARRTAAGQENVLTTRNRVERLQAERRDVQRRLDGTSRAQWLGRPAEGEYREQLEARAAELDDAIAFNQRRVAEAEASGRAVTVTRDDVQRGDHVRTRGQWREVVRVNPKSVSVSTGYSWTDTVPYREVQMVRRRGENGEWVDVTPRPEPVEDVPLEESTPTAEEAEVDVPAAPESAPEPSEVPVEGAPSYRLIERRRDSGVLTADVIAPDGAQISRASKPPGRADWLAMYEGRRYRGESAQEVATEVALLHTLGQNRQEQQRREAVEPDRAMVRAGDLAAGDRVEFVRGDVSGETATGEVESANEAAGRVFARIRGDDGQTYTRAYEPDAELRRADAAGPPGEPPEAPPAPPAAEEPEEPEEELPEGLPRVGDIVRIRPIGKNRRTTVEIDHPPIPVGDNTFFIMGRLPSSQWPGDYRGATGANVRMQDIEILRRAGEPESTEGTPETPADVTADPAEQERYDQLVDTVRTRLVRAAGRADGHVETAYRQALDTVLAAERDRTRSPADRAEAVGAAAQQLRQGARGANMPELADEAEELERHLAAFRRGETPGGALTEVRGDNQLEGQIGFEVERPELGMILADEPERREPDRPQQVEGQLGFGEEEEEAPTAPAPPASPPPPTRPAPAAAEEPEETEPPAEPGATEEPAPADEPPFERAADLARMEELAAITRTFGTREEAEAAGYRFDVTSPGDVAVGDDVVLYSRGRLRTGRVARVGRTNAAVEYTTPGAITEGERIADAYRNRDPVADAERVRQQYLKNWDAFADPQGRWAEGSAEWRQKHPDREAYAQTYADVERNNVALRRMWARRSPLLFAHPTTKTTPLAELGRREPDRSPDQPVVSDDPDAAQAAAAKLAQTLSEPGGENAVAQVDLDPPSDAGPSEPVPPPPPENPPEPPAANEPDVVGDAHLPAPEPTPEPDPLTPPPGVWSKRIQIVEEDGEVYVYGTQPKGQPPAIKAALTRNRRFFWDKANKRWQHTGKGDREEEVENLRETLRALDKIEADTAAAATGAGDEKEQPKKFPPTPQQQAIMDAFARGDDVAVLALAGTGKTSTLIMLGELARGKKVVYLAFNKTIQVEAAEKFKDMPWVEVLTADALARRSWTRKHQDRIFEGLRGAGEVGEFLGITDDIDLPDGEVLEKDDLVRAAQATIDSYSISDDRDLGAKHVPEGLSADVVLPHARKVWEDIKDPDGELYFDFNHGAKLWALSDPKLPYDVIFFDEAQDINDVRAAVVRAQTAQKVVVGDSNQSIYSFIGAKDQLKGWKADSRLPLDQSWRFGQPIADYGNKFLARAGSAERIRGNPGKDAEVGPMFQGGANIADLDAVLTRTNVGAIGAIKLGLDHGLRVAMAGGKNEIKNLAEGARDLMRGRRTTRHSELAPYRNWQEVRELSERDQGLATLVRIVDEGGGVNGLLDLHRRMTVEEDQVNPPDLVVSTVHKAKGREWNNVRIGDDFPQPRQNPRTGEWIYPEGEELRIAYVAVTRAMSKLDPGSLSWIEGSAGDDERAEYAARHEADRQGLVARPDPADPGFTPQEVAPTDGEQGRVRTTSGGEFEGTISTDGQDVVVEDDAGNITEIPAERVANVTPAEPETTPAPEPTPEVPGPREPTEGPRVAVTVEEAPDVAEPPEAGSPESMDSFQASAAIDTAAIESGLASREEVDRYNHLAVTLPPFSGDTPSPPYYETQTPLSRDGSYTVQGTHEWTSPAGDTFRLNPGDVVTVRHREDGGLDGTVTRAAGPERREYAPGEEVPSSDLAPGMFVHLSGSFDPETFDPFAVTGEIVNVTPTSERWTQRRMPRGRRDEKRPPGYLVTVRSGRSGRQHSVFVYPGRDHEVLDPAALATDQTRPYYDPEKVRPVGELNDKELNEERRNILVAVGLMRDVLPNTPDADMPPVWGQLKARNEELRGEERRRIDADRTRADTAPVDPIDAVGLEPYGEGAYKVTGQDGSRIGYVQKARRGGGWAWVLEGGETTRSTTYPTRQEALRALLARHDSNEQERQAAQERAEAIERAVRAIPEGAILTSATEIEVSDRISMPQGLRDGHPTSYGPPVTVLEVDVMPTGGAWIRYRRGDGRTDRALVPAIFADRIARFPAPEAAPEAPGETGPPRDVNEAAVRAARRRREARGRGEQETPETPEPTQEGLFGGGEPPTPPPAPPAAPEPVEPRRPTEPPQAKPSGTQLGLMAHLAAGNTDTGGYFASTRDAAIGRGWVTQDENGDLHLTDEGRRQVDTAERPPMPPPGSIGPAEARTAVPGPDLPDVRPAQTDPVVPRPRAPEPVDTEDVRAGELTAGDRVMVEDENYKLVPATVVDVDPDDPAAGDYYVRLDVRRDDGTEDSIYTPEDLQYPRIRAREPAPTAPGQPAAPVAEEGTPADPLADVDLPNASDDELAALFSQHIDNPDALARLEAEAARRDAAEQQARATELPDDSRAPRGKAPLSDAQRRRLVETLAGHPDPATARAVERVRAGEPITADDARALARALRDTDPAPAAALDAHADHLDISEATAARGGDSTRVGALVPGQRVTVPEVPGQPEITGTVVNVTTSGRHAVLTVDGDDGNRHQRTLRLSTNVLARPVYGPGGIPEATAPETPPERPERGPASGVTAGEHVALPDGTVGEATDVSASGGLVDVTVDTPAGRRRRLVPADGQVWHLPRPADPQPTPDAVPEDLGQGTREVGPDEITEGDRIRITGQPETELVDPDRLSVGDVIFARRTDESQGPVTVEAVREDGAHYLVAGRDENGDRVYARIPRQHHAPKAMMAKRLRAAGPGAEPAFGRPMPAAAGDEPGPRTPGELRDGDIIDATVGVPVGRGREQRLRRRVRLVGEPRQQGMFTVATGEAVNTNGDPIIDPGTGRPQRHRLNLANGRPVQLHERRPTPPAGGGVDDDTTTVGDPSGEDVSGVVVATNPVVETGPDGTPEVVLETTVAVDGQPDLEQHSFTPGDRVTLVDRNPAGPEEAAADAEERRSSQRLDRGADTVRRTRGRLVRRIRFEAANAGVNVGARDGRDVADYLDDPQVRQRVRGEVLEDLDAAVAEIADRLDPDNRHDRARVEAEARRLIDAVAERALSRAAESYRQARRLPGDADGMAGVRRVNEVLAAEEHDRAPANVTGDPRNDVAEALDNLGPAEGAATPPTVPTPAPRAPRVPRAPRAPRASRAPAGRAPAYYGPGYDEYGRAIPITAAERIASLLYRLVAGGFGLVRRRVSRWRADSRRELDEGRDPSTEVVDELTPDRASDGGPGHTAMRHLQVLDELGDVVDGEMARRIGEQVGRDVMDRHDRDVDELDDADRALREGLSSVEMDVADELIFHFSRWGVGNMAEARERIDAFEQRARQTWGPAKFWHRLRARNLSRAVDEAPRVAARVRANREPQVRQARASRAAAFARVQVQDGQLRQARIDAAREQLAQVRPLGAAGPNRLQLATEAGEQARAVRWVEQWVPTDWLAAHRAGRDRLEVVDGPGGAVGYEPGRRLLVADREPATPGSGRHGQTAAYAVGHHLAATVPEIRAAEEAYLWKRSARSGRIGSRVRGEPDFADPRAAQEHRDGGYSVFAAGLEGLLTGRDDDPDLRRFTLGVLAGLGRVRTPTRRRRDVAGQRRTRARREAARRGPVAPDVEGMESAPLADIPFTEEPTPEPIPAAGVTTTRGLRAGITADTDLTALSDTDLVAFLDRHRNDPEMRARLEAETVRREEANRADGDPLADVNLSELSDAELAALASRYGFDPGVLARIEAEMDRRDETERRESADPLAGINLATASDEEIAALFRTHGDDPAVATRLAAELDRRDEQDRAAREADEDTAGDETAAGWVAQSSALDQAWGANSEGEDPRTRRRRLEADKREAFHREQRAQARAAYDAWAADTFRQARDQLRGSLLSREGKRAGISEEDLFSDRLAKSRRNDYASDALLKWWRKNRAGPRTLGEFAKQRGYDINPPGRMGPAAAAWNEYKHRHYLEAEAATNGYMLSKAGERANIDPRDIVTGKVRDRDFDRWASEELKAWVAEHGRVYWTDFEAAFRQDEAGEAAGIRRQRGRTLSEFG